MPQSIEAEAREARRPWAGRLCAAALVTTGATVLMGWALDVSALKSVVPGLIRMRANTALGFLLAGAALATLREDPRRNRLAAGLAASVATIGGLTLLEHLAGVDLGIDEALFLAPPESASSIHPGRMMPTTALDFALLGVATILIAADRRHWVAHALALLAGLLAGSALVGYAYGVRSFLWMAAYNQMALHTALGMLIFSAAVLMARPRRGLMAAIAGGTAGGLMARRLLPVAVLVPFTLDGLALLAERSEVFDARFATATRVVATIAIFVGCIGWNAHALHRLDGERRRADQALRLMADAMPQLAWMARPDGHISWYNRRWYDYTGTTAEQMEGWGWRSVHDPAELPRVLVRWRACIASGEPFEMDFPLRGADGQFRRFLTRVEAARGEDGLILHWFGTNTDIEDQKRVAEGLRHAGEELERRVAGRTAELALANEGLTREVRERRRAEDELRRGEQQFRTLADSIPQLAWMALPDGNIFWYNQRWYDYTGTTLEQMRGWGWRSVHDPDELPRVVESIKASYASGEPWECTFPLRRHDGAFRWHLTRMLPIRDEAGRVAMWFGSNTDVTEHKQLEATLREAKEAAEAATRAKGEFLANMSHEIRTPMNGVLGMTELALGTDLTPPQREYLGLAKSSAEALLVVIDDILDFSKIEAGKLTLDATPFDLREAVTDTLRALALRAHEKGLELACRVAPGVPGWVIGDRGRLRQVLVNLVGNAIKFTEAGEVLVSVEAGEDGPLRFAVADTGIGLPAAKREAIFAPFEQADGSTTRKYGGTGLGLTISHRLVELMGGRIWVEDNPGGGSVFRFTARLGSDSESRPGHLPADPGRLAGLPVLIVDDNRTNRRILEELLAAWGCRPRSASGGAEALAALAAAAESGRPFELMLLDRMMPGMDGLELAGRVRRDPALAGVKMLMLTSGGDDESGRFRELGIGGWLSKPVRQSELRDALLDVLEPAGRPLPISGPAPVGVGPVPSGRRLRVLLAEDHPINQKVASRMLEDLGHEVTIVGDGRAAVEASGACPFDVILMDVQMPAMDGFEATAAIRRREGGSDRHVPIVALTAHAMAGDRERCLGSGFDDYLSKPIQAATLRAALGRLDGPGAGPRAETPGEVAGRVPAFDRRSALENLGGDEALLDEVLGLFLDDCPRLLGSIRDAVGAGDAATLGRLAHTVSGVAGNFAAPAVVDAARRLQAMGQSGELAGAGGAEAELGRAVDRFRIAAGATGVGAA